MDEWIFVLIWKHARWLIIFVESSIYSQASQPPGRANQVVWTTRAFPCELNDICLNLRYSIKQSKIIYIYIYIIYCHLNLCMWLCILYIAYRLIKRHHLYTLYNSEPLDGSSQPLKTGELAVEFTKQTQLFLSFSTVISPQRPSRLQKIKYIIVLPFNQVIVYISTEKLTCIMNIPDLIICTSTRMSV